MKENVNNTVTLYTMKVCGTDERTDYVGFSLFMPCFDNNNIEHNIICIFNKE